MAALSNSKRGVRLAVTLSVGWAFLWLVPWQSWLGGLPWLGLVIAFVAFIVPGACLYHLLYTGQPPRLSAYLTVGFALSVTWVGFIGLIARIVHLPFLFVYYSLFVAGEIGIILVSLNEERLPRPRWPTFDRSLLRAVVIALPTIVIVAAAAKLAAGPYWGGDKETYTAFITNWQHSTSLDFREVFMGTENVLSVRFWLSLFPMTVALIAKLSGVHGLLVSAIYLRPALVVLASLCVYELARTLGLSADLAALAVVAQLFFLFLLTDDIQPGMMFFQRLEEDKVVASYVLSPILIRLIKEYLDESSGRRFALLLLAGFSLTFTHPTAMGVACLIGGLFSLFNLLTYRQFKPFLTVGLALFIILAAPFSLRFFDSATTSAYTENFSIEYHIEEHTGRTLTRLYMLEDNRWYGLPSTLLMVTAPFDPNDAPTLPVKAARNSVFGLIALTSILIVSRLKRRQAVDHYLIAGSVVLFLGMLPYTGRILGIMLTPLHLWRIPWQFPYGIMFAFLIMVLRRPREAGQMPAEGEPPGPIGQVIPFAAAYLLAAAGLALMPMATVKLTLPARYQDLEYTSLVEVGKKLDELIPEQAVVLGDDVRNSFLPGLSAHAKVIMMRQTEVMGNYGLNLKEAKQRDAAFSSIMLDVLPPAELIALMQQYDVKYMLLSDDEDSSGGILREVRDHLKLIDTFGGLSLFEFAPDWAAISELTGSDPSTEALLWLAENTPEGSVIATNVRAVGQFNLLAGRIILAEGQNVLHLLPKDPARSSVLADDLYAFFEDPENEVDNLERLDPDYVVFVRQDDVLGERFAGWETRLPTLRERLMLEEQVRFGEEDEIVIYEVVPPPDE